MRTKTKNPKIASKIITSITAVFFVFLLFSSVSSAFIDKETAKNYFFNDYGRIKNGGFEQDLNFWLYKTPYSSSSPQISTKVFKDGNKSVYLGEIWNSYDYIYQKINFVSTTFYLEYWFYPTALTSKDGMVLELVRNWDLGLVGKSDVITRVWFQKDKIYFMSWEKNVYFAQLGNSTVINKTIELNKWHKIVVESNGLIGRQKLSIDNETVATTYNCPLATFTPQYIILGDVSAHNYGGTAYYDAIYLKNKIWT